MVVVMRSLAFSAILFAPLTLVACGDDDGCSPGFEACGCTESGQCLTGLTCLSNICVNASGTDAGPGFDAGPAFDGGPGFDGGPSGTDGGPITDAGPGVFDTGGMLRDGGGPNPDAFFAEDPPPMECREDGTVGTPDEVPGGTPECPDDKNREGCPCTNVGETEACWPGLRVNRNRGICTDGVTTCIQDGEFEGRWGPCTGFRLPQEGVELGPAACGCFSRGRWALENLSPCFITYGDGSVHAVSTEIGAGGTAQCPMVPSTPPPPAPASNFSENTLTVDCEGRFNLCYTLKAGNADDPSDADCTMAQVCTEGWYAARDIEQAFPVLPGWSGSDPVCAQQFRDSGGYGEMTVQGLSVECETIDDGGAPYVFNRVNYCPLSCNMTPDLPECAACMMGGSGSF